MPYQLFRDLFPEMANRETRSITVLPGNDAGLPPGEYGFLEMYCNDKGCDCRRVLFTVLSRERRRIEAVVAWGWEDRAFYKNWLGFADPLTVTELKGPSLNLGSPATDLAPAILRLVQDILLADADYVERIKRHYQMFREKIDAPKPAGKRKRKPKQRPETSTG